MVRRSSNRPRPSRGPSAEIDGPVEVEREDGGVLPQAQEQQLLATAGEVAGHVGAQIGQLEAALLGAALDHWLAVPQGQRQRGGRGEHFLQPGLVRPPLAGAVEGIAGEGVDERGKGHGLQQRLLRRPAPPVMPALASTMPPRDSDGGDRRWAEASPTRSGPEGSSRNEIHSGSSAGLHLTPTLSRCG